MLAQWFVVHPRHSLRQWTVNGTFWKAGSLKGALCGECPDLIHDVAYLQYEHVHVSMLNAISQDEVIVYQKPCTECQIVTVYTVFSDLLHRFNAGSYIRFGVVASRNRWMFAIAFLYWCTRTWRHFLQAFTWLWKVIQNQVCAFPCTSGVAQDEDAGPCCRFATIWWSRFHVCGWLRPRRKWFRDSPMCTAENASFWGNVFSVNDLRSWSLPADFVYMLHSSVKSDDIGSMRSPGTQKFPLVLWTWRALLPYRADNTHGCSKHSCARCQWLNDRYIVVLFYDYPSMRRDYHFISDRFQVSPRSVEPDSPARSFPLQLLRWMWAVVRFIYWSSLLAGAVPLASDPTNRLIIMMSDGLCWGTPSRLIKLDLLH